MFSFVYYVLEAWNAWQRCRYNVGGKKDLPTQSSNNYMNLIIVSSGTDKQSQEYTLVSCQEFELLKLGKLVTELFDYARTRSNRIYKLALDLTINIVITFGHD